MLDEAQGTYQPSDYVQFFGAGSAVRGSFQCADCGYGVSVQASLPQCPMCGGSSWERVLRNGPWETWTRPERP